MTEDRPVVVIQSGDAFENRMRVLPIAVACRAHGWEPVVLIEDLGAASAFALHGVACLPAREIGEPDLPDYDLDVDDICALQLRIGELTGRPLQDKDWETIRKRTSQLWWMLDRLAPRAVFVWNGFTGVWANALRAYKAERGLPGGFMERGPSQNELFVDPEGVNGLASLARSSEAPAPPVAALAARDRAPPAGAREKILFVPLQVQTDSNILLNSSRLVRMRDLANFALRLRQALGETWRVVLRPHPEERPETQLNLPRDRCLTLDVEHSLEHWLESASLCLTINSNVGLKAALCGLPTICLGEGLYCRRPFVIAGQRCQFGELKAAALALLGDPSAIAAGAAAFLEELRAKSLFWLGQPPDLAASKLERLGLARRDPGGGGSGFGGPQGASVAWPGPAYDAMLERLARLRESAGPITADFDFLTTDTLFLTYRRNREPLTREHISTRAGETLGSPVTLNAVHRTLEASGRILITHSKRAQPAAADYDLVLDEFGYPHARTYLQVA